MFSFEDLYMIFEADKYRQSITMIIYNMIIVILMSIGIHKHCVDNEPQFPQIKQVVPTSYQVVLMFFLFLFVFPHLIIRLCNIQSLFG